MKNLALLLFLFIASFVFSQQVEYVDFKTAKADLKIKPLGREVAGTIIYEFDVIKDIDSIYIDANDFIHIEALFNEKIYHDYNRITYEFCSW